MRRSTLVLLLIVLSTAGCAYMMPPQKIPLDRANYLDAVSTSWKEQLLSNLVRLRYGETLTSLEMTSVTTSYELDAGLTAGQTIGWGQVPDTSVFRNAATVGGSIAYANKPTITYVPMRGEALAQTMIKPIDPLKILKALQTGWKADYVFPCSIKCINNWRNPSDDKFFEFARLFQDLKKRGVIRIAAEEPVEPKVTKVPDDYTVTLKHAEKPGKEKTCEEGTDKKKEDKEDNEIGFLVVDNTRAKEEDLMWKELKELKDFVSNSLNYCYGSKSLDECISERLKYLGIDLHCTYGNLLNGCSNSRSMNDYANTSSTRCDEGTTLTYYVRQSLDNCRNSEHLDDCLSETLKTIAEHVTLKEKVSCFEQLLWPKYDDQKEAWHESYKKECVGCHDKLKNRPEFHACDLDRQITKAVTCGHGKMLKIDDMKQSELKEIISYLKHSSDDIKDSSEASEVYKIIDANQKLPLDPYCNKIFMQTQSILQTLTTLSRLIDVPPEHTKKAEPQRPDYQTLSTMLNLKISYTKQYPANVFVAIPYRGFWFYIDDNDYNSKDAFSSTQGIFSMSETGTKEGTPVLTLPVQ